MDSIFFGLLAVFSFSVAPTFLRNDQTIIHDPDSPFLEISPFYFNFGAANIPKPEKKAKGGEDALLASKYLLGVADGVGSWVNHGIDPRDYSYRLLHNADLYFRAYPQAYANNPRKLLFLSTITNAYKGSSTMTLCSLSGMDLFTANVGDSGYMVFVPVLKNLPKNAGTSFIYDSVFQSEAQQKGYNFPFQLGPTGDNPHKATKSKVHRMGYGALVIVYTDGVSDNLFPGEIKVIVNMYIQELKMKSGIQIRDFVPIFNSKELAERIKQKAFERSIDNNAISPFQVKALEHAVMFKGGKSDDISVVVGMVVNKPKPKSTEEPKKSVEPVKETNTIGPKRREKGGDSGGNK